MFEDAKLNLKRIKDLRDSLPSYLKMTEAYGPDGKKIKVPDNTMEVQHPKNLNRLNTLPSAKNKVAANNLGRGLTVPFIW